MQNIIPQPTEEMPFIIKDYPYGFRQRTKAKYYIETDHRKGQRVVFQTLNPRKGTWNAPKKSTYSDIAVLYLDDINHCVPDYLHFSGDQKEHDDFISKYEKCLNNWQKDKLLFFQSMIETRKHVTWTVKEQKTINTDEPLLKAMNDIIEKQHQEEQAEIMHKLKSMTVARYKELKALQNG